MQVEIDEFRDYDKALGALREALRQLASSTSTTAPDLRKSLERKVLLMERFIHARDIEKDEPDKMVDICEVYQKPAQQFNSFIPIHIRIKIHDTYLGY